MLQISEIRKKKESVIAQQKFEKAADMRDKELRQQAIMQREKETTTK